MWELKDAGNVAPFYLLNGTTLLEDVKAGQPITKDVVDLSEAFPINYIMRIEALIENRLSMKL